MNTTLQPTSQTIAAKPSALGVMASRLSVEPNKLLETLKATVFKNATNEEMLALVVVANEYKLNPLLKEMYAFPAKGGGIVPVVGVDGWTKIVNRQETFDGVEFAWQWEDDGKPVACTCTMHVKGRAKPVVVTEFLEECARPTDPWKNMPRRMLRHRAFIQAARVAFGLSGIMEEDEAADIIDVASSPVAPLPLPLPVKEAAPAKPEPASDEPTPQQQLANLCESNGFTFDHLQKFGVESGNIENADALASFNDIPKATAARLLRAKTGLLQGLSLLKEAV